MCEDKEYKNKSRQLSYLIVPVDNNIYRFVDIGWNDLIEINQCIEWISNKHPEQQRVISWLDANFIVNKFVIRISISGNKKEYI